MTTQRRLAVSYARFSNPVQAAGDSEGAREAMKKHLGRVAREFARGWDVAKRADAPAPRKRAR